MRMKGIPESGCYMKLVMIIKAEICSVLICQGVLFCLKSVNWPIKTIRDLTRVIVQLIVHLKGLFTIIHNVVFRILTRFAHMFDNMTLVTVSPPEYDTPTVSPQGIMMLWARFLQILDMPI